MADPPTFALVVPVVLSMAMGFGCASLSARAAAPDEQGFVASMRDFGPDPAGPSVRVHIESRYPVSIVRLGDDNDVVERCNDPCDRELVLAGRYRLDGNDVRSSWPFQLVGQPGERVVLHVSPSLRSTYATAKTTGTVSMVIGGAGLGIALAAGFAGFSASSDANGGRAASCAACEGVGILGAVLLVVGIGVGTYALVGQISNMSSSVEEEQPLVPGRPPSIWRNPDPIEGSLPRRTQVTVLSGRF